MNYMDVHEASVKWNLTERRITALLREGRIPGAVKEGRAWLIPADTQKPEDKRSAKASKQQVSAVKRPLPIGVVDYREMVTSYYYVDKTLMIRDFLDTIPKVSLFTRPRRFGKTLNMDMLRVFFEISKEDTSVYFRDKKIWSCGDKYRRHQGKYPVIFVTFKDIKMETWEDTRNTIEDIIRLEYKRHSELADSEKNTHRDFYDKIINGSADQTDIQRAFFMLSQMLHEHYGIAPVIIIDEYDTPIHQGYMRNYYDKVIPFMRNLFSSCFKDNPHLSFGFMTGILRVAKESIFSGLNNLSENSVLDERFSEYFGFTHDEISDMMTYYGRTEKAQEICDWYDGYQFGGTEIFNPWSVISYLDKNCIPRAYWISTANNDVIHEIISEATPEIKENLQLLMQGKSVAAYIDPSVIYPEIGKNPHTIYSFLLMTGYLKLTDMDAWRNGNAFCEVAIPNKEIFYVYEREILSALAPAIPQSTALAIQQAIVKQDIPALKEHLQNYLRQTISVFDTSDEGFYHGMMLGLYAIMNNRYVVTSNRESGEGRYDIQMKPYDMKMPGILVELKVLRDKQPTEEKLQALSQKALSQIQEKHYSDEMTGSGIKSILMLGIAFCQKQTEISFSMMEN